VDPDHVFLRKVQDLESRTDVTRLAAAIDADYEILMAAPLLRELIMGEPPLMHTVNRSRRLKIRFRVSYNLAYEQVVFADKPISYARGDGLYPGAAMPKDTIQEQTIDQFLREMVMVIQGETITVRDLIDYVANAAGAVHFGDLAKDKRAIMADLDTHLRLGGAQASLRALTAIGRIVATALEPLARRVEADIAR
jgi:hypothetical protein